MPTRFLLVVDAPTIAADPEGLAARDTRAMIVEGLKNV